jgi:hypothetical protein
MLCAFASPRATLECAKSFSSTDFRSGFRKCSYINYSWNEDKTVPIGITSEIAAKLIRTINLLFMKELLTVYFTLKR